MEYNNPDIANLKFMQKESQVLYFLLALKSKTVKVVLKADREVKSQFPLERKLSSVYLQCIS